MAQLFYVPKLYDQESGVLQDVELPLEEAQRIVAAIFCSIDATKPAQMRPSSEAGRSVYLFSYSADMDSASQSPKAKQPAKEAVAVHFLYASESRRIFSFAATGFVEITKNYSNFLGMLRLSGSTMRREAYRFTPMAEASIHDKVHVKEAVIRAYECSTISLIQIPDHLPDPIAYIVSLDPHFIYYRLAFSCQLNEGRGEGDDVDYFGQGINLVQHKAVADVLMNGVVMSLFLSALKPQVPKHTFITLSYVAVDADQYDTLFHAAAGSVLVHTMSDIILVQHQICPSSTFNNRSPTLICPPTLLPRNVVDTSQAQLTNGLRNVGCIGSPWLYRLLSFLNLRC